MEQLTVKEALEQGYTQFLYSSGGFQRLSSLSEICEEDFKKDGVELVEKEPHHPLGLDVESFREDIADNLECQHSGETGDDTSEVYNTVISIDLKEFESIVNIVNDKLSGLNYYKSTGIKLIP